MTNKKKKSKIEDGFTERLDEYRIRVWKETSDGGGFWVVERDYSNRPETKKVLEEMALPVNCPICKSRWIKFNPQSHKIYWKWGCCDLCLIEHVEGNEEKWEEGWRPDEKQIQYWLSRRQGKQRFSFT